MTRIELKFDDSGVVGHAVDPRIKLVQQYTLALIGNPTAPTPGPFNGPGDEWFFIDPSTDDRWTRTDGLTIPPKGARILAHMNGFFPGTVVGYLRTWASSHPQKSREYRMLGLIVLMDERPKWAIEQHRGKWFDGLALVLPNEWKPLEVRDEHEFEITSSMADYGGFPYRCTRCRLTLGMGEMPNEKPRGKCDPSKLEVKERAIERGP